jgi:hypothetical protein
MLPRPSTFATLLLTLVGLAAATSRAGAQAAETVEADTLRTGYQLPGPPTIEVTAKGGGVAPGISMANPTAFGAEWGDLFGGVGYQHRTRLHTRNDGAAFFGAGFGNAWETIGLEATVAIFGTARSCCRGGLSLKAHRLLPRDWAVAVGWENVATWAEFGGDFRTDSGSSPYAVASKVIHLQQDKRRPLSTLSLTGGAGLGRFRTEANIINDRNMPNVFGGAALRVIEPVAVIGEWTGHDLNAGVSIAPFRRVPVFLTLGAADLTDRPRFVAGAGTGTNFWNPVRF